MNSLAVENNRRLLIIDDSRPIHDDFRKILAAESAEKTALDQAEAAILDLPMAGSGRPSFEIVSAYQGQEGLDLARAARQAGRPYAMAFVDVRMPPGWDGIETTARMWKIDPDLQIVICSAYADYSWGELTAKLGCSDRFVILKKPFEPAEVLQLASALTEKWRLSQESKQQLQHLETEVSKRTQDLQSVNASLGAINQELEAALAKVKTLSGLLPICAGCKKIRDDRGYWNQLESYIQQHSDARLTHGLCPDCAEHYFPGLG
jgi:CheY-like chemotaxis protein